MTLLITAAIVIAAWSVIALRQYDKLSNNVAGLLMCLTCGSGFIGSLALGISLLPSFLALTAMAFLSVLLWSYGYLR